jgi:hypothetical protein
MFAAREAAANVPEDCRLSITNPSDKEVVVQ